MILIISYLDQAHFFYYTNNHMTRGNFTNLLIGKDLRRVRQNSIVVTSVRDQASFDELFTLALSHERPLVMRAIDAVEKVTKKHPEFLFPHKVQLLSIMKSADHKELKWHIAKLISRLQLSSDEARDVSHLLIYWALNRNESKIVRVNALQGLFELSETNTYLTAEFLRIMSVMEGELIPSIQARIRKLKSLI